MSELCPDCGRPNPEAAESCAHCNYPLRSAPGEAGSATRDALETEGARSTPPPEPTADPVIPIPRIPLRRPARRGAPLAGQAVSLWLFFGAVAAVVLVYTAFEANRQRLTPTKQVEGSSAEQQKQVEAAQAALARDSTNVDAHVSLANVLYDTGNWDDAIIHYRAALRRDSSRVAALVDLGVCYYNQGDTPEAERLFQFALAKDPHQPVALFNLGIVNERHERYEAALQYYHRALENARSEEAKRAVVAGIQRMQEKTGRRPGPLPGSASRP